MTQETHSKKQRTKFSDSNRIYILKSSVKACDAVIALNMKWLREYRRLLTIKDPLIRERAINRFKIDHIGPFSPSYAEFWGGEFPIRTTVKEFYKTHPHPTPKELTALRKQVSAFDKRNVQWLRENMNHSTKQIHKYLKERCKVRRELREYR